ncbi:MAG: peptide deformylase [Halothiobacillus sp.]
MSLLEIVLFPDERLRRVATDVTQFDARLARVTEQMLTTMYESRGVGLAATQVDVQQRLFVADCADDGQSPAPLVFINPIILDRQGLVESEEGCLSIPDVNDKVMRAETVSVRAQTIHGTEFELTTSGLLAICIQHEIDHLNGKLFIDYLSPLKQQRIRKKLEKVQRQKALDAKDFV